MISSKFKRLGECNHQHVRSLATKIGQAYLFGHENRTSESLRDSVVTKTLQDYGSSLTIEVL